MVDAHKYTGIVKDVAFYLSRGQTDIVLRREELESEGWYWLCVGAGKFNGRGSERGFLRSFVTQRVTDYVRRVKKCRKGRLNIAGQAQAMALSQMRTIDGPEDWWEIPDNTMEQRTQDRIDMSLIMGRADERTRGVLKAQLMGYTQADIGRFMGLTRGRITQLTKSAKP